MVHVEDMGRSLAFYEALGGRVLFGSRDGDYALLAFGGGTLALLAHPPGPGSDPVDLQFAAAGGLEDLETRLRTQLPGCVLQGVSDEAFGRLLTLRSPEGRQIKVVEVEADLIA